MPVHKKSDEMLGDCCQTCSLRAPMESTGHKARCKNPESIMFRRLMDTSVIGRDDKNSSKHCQGWTAGSRFPQETQDNTVI